LKPLSGLSSFFPFKGGPVNFSPVGFRGAHFSAIPSIPISSSSHLLEIILPFFPLWRSFRFKWYPPTPSPTVGSGSLVPFSSRRPEYPCVLVGFRKFRVNGVSEIYISANTAFNYRAPKPYAPTTTNLFLGPLWVPPSTVIMFFFFNSNCLFSSSFLVFFFEVVFF